MIWSHEWTWSPENFLNLSWEPFSSLEWRGSTESPGQFPCQKVGALDLCPYHVPPANKCKNLVPLQAAEVMLEILMLAQGSILFCSEYNISLTLNPRPNSYIQHWMYCTRGVYTGISIYYVHDVWLGLCRPYRKSRWPPEAFSSSQSHGAT